MTKDPSSDEGTPSNKEVPLVLLARDAGKGPVEFARRRGTGFLLFTGILRRPTGRATVQAEADHEVTGESQLVVFPLIRSATSNFPFVTIGRVEGNDVILPDASVSKFHAFAKETAKGWAIRDGGSRNGTFVNEQPAAVRDAAEPTLLVPHANVRLGSVRLVFLDAPSLIAVVNAMT